MSNNTIDLESLKKMMDAYGNYEHQKSIVNSERQLLKNSRLSIDQQSDLESIDSEFDDKIKLIEENEKKVRKQLDLMIEQYIKEVQNSGVQDTKINSQLMTLNIDPDETVEWNTKGLDELIKQGQAHLLEYRIVKKLKTRLTKKKV